MTPSIAKNSNAVHRINADGQSRIVLVCEHASNYIPLKFKNLGLSELDQQSHAAWDPGAMTVAEHLSDWLDAKLVAGAVSRLVYDLNRPPDAPSAMPGQSERIVIPGNANLSDNERAARASTYYTPFHAAVWDALARTVDPILVTIHSFTPVFNGTKRDIEIGILHDVDSRLADAMLCMAPAHTTLKAQRNAPYGPTDGVTHTLREHSLRGGHPNVMLEIRNDLIANEKDQARMARMLGPWLTEACRAVTPLSMRA